MVGIKILLSFDGAVRDAVLLGRYRVAQERHHHRVRFAHSVGLCARVCACACARVRVRVRACARVSVRTYGCVGVRLWDWG